WSSDVCSSDLQASIHPSPTPELENKATYLSPSASPSRDVAQTEAYPPPLPVRGGNRRSRTRFSKRAAWNRNGTLRHRVKPTMDVGIVRNVDVHCAAQRCVPAPGGGRNIPVDHGIPRKIAEAASLRDSPAIRQ